jgi:hypothetical protein
MIQKNGRPVRTRTADLYRVKLAVRTLKRVRAEKLPGHPAALEDDHPCVGANERFGERAPQLHEHPLAGSQRLPQRPF